MGRDGGEKFEAIALAGRRALRDLWSRRREKASMAEQERALLEILEEHQEYQPYWEGKEPDDELNPFLHVQFHEILYKQLAAGDPPGSQAALDRLVAAGKTLHEAQHEVLRVLMSEFHGMLTTNREFDEEGYARKLDKLGRG